MPNVRKLSTPAINSVFAILPLGFD